MMPPHPGPEPPGRQHVGGRSHPHSLLRVAQPENCTAPPVPQVWLSEVVTSVSLGPSIRLSLPTPIWKLALSTYWAESSVGLASGPPGRFAGLMCKCYRWEEYSFV